MNVFMTVGTFSFFNFEIPLFSFFMTALTWNSKMSSGKNEVGFYMPLNCIRSGIESVYGMTNRAIGLSSVFGKFSLMIIRMTVNTLFKFWFGIQSIFMTGFAINIGMLSEQRIICFGMVKVG